MKDYSDFFGERKNIERVKGIGNIGKREDEVVGFANFEIFEDDFVRFGDEGLAFEDFGSDFLRFGHIEFMIFPCLFEMYLFLLGEVAWVDDFITVFVVFGECFRLVIRLHLNFMKL